MTSLQASSNGIKICTSALIDKKFTQEQLARALSISRQPVSKFFNGKLIDSGLFVQICEKLGQNWKDVAVNQGSSNELTLLEEADIENLLIAVRNKIKPKIQEQCGSMRVLDMTHPIGLCDIYTDVNILETVLGRRWVGIEELSKGFDPDLESFDRCGLGKVVEKRVPALSVVSRYPKLMVLGKPGAGKSTFLKYLAIQCIWENIQAKRIPIFITLKEFAEADNQPELLDFIVQIFSAFDISYSEIKYLLDSGRFLILLDGLDEVREEDSKRIIQQIQIFSEQFFFSQEFNVDRDDLLDERNKKLKKIEKIKSDKIQAAKSLENYQRIYEEIIIEYEREEKNISKDYPELLKNFDGGIGFLSGKFPEKIYSNLFVVTCRIAAREYVFPNFVDVEVADFDKGQINFFANNWFGLKKDLVKGKKFVRQLKQNQSLLDLASSPLLLTLLCLVFEDSADFPINRSELYKEGVSILLKKWDSQRNIERDPVYKKLSVPRKEDLLSSVAFHTFEQKSYFFKQREVENYIAQYIRNLPDAKTDQKALQLDSEVVLKSIEAQHGLLVERARGIYSFSHLTFQEYFTARKIITTSEPEDLEKVLYDLSTHINEKRWREVLLLALGMIPSAERLLKLLKQQVDNILSEDPELQELLIWVREKSLSYDPYKSEAIRCIYFVIGCDLTQELSKSRTTVISFEPDLERALGLVKLLDKNLVNDIIAQSSIARFIIRDFIITRDLTRDLAIDIARNLNSILGSQEKKILKPVTQELPDFTRDKTFIADWWADNGSEWTKEFRLIMKEHYNIGHDRRFNLRQRSTLKKYYDANKMMLECLNSGCYVKPEVRQEIRESLFLPK
jgi:predicted NACHT family NTPase